MKDNILEVIIEMKDGWHEAGFENLLASAIETAIKEDLRAYVEIIQKEVNKDLEVTVKKVVIERIKKEWIERSEVARRLDEIYMKTGIDLYQSIMDFKSELKGDGENDKRRKRISL